MTVEVRDGETARAFLDAGLALARTTPSIERADAAALLHATLGEMGSIPPPGVVVDVAALIRGGAVNARAPRPADVELARALEAYEHLVLARIAADPLVSRLGDAVSRLRRDLVAPAVGILVANVLGRLAHAGTTLPAAAVRALGRAATDDAFAALRDVPAAVALLRDGYRRLVVGARAARTLLAERDVFVLEHLDVLETLAQRVAMEQVVDAGEALSAGLPRRLPRRRPAGAVLTALDDDDTYPVGGFSAITNVGAFENLVTSELVYMDDDPALDLFDVRWVTGELLYYTRDEATSRRARRAIDFVIDGEVRDARARDAELPWQRAVATLAIVHVCITKLAAWLGDEDVTIRVVVPRDLEDERALLELLLREPIDRGIVAVVRGDAAASDAHLETAARVGIAQQVRIGGAPAAAPSGVESVFLPVGRGSLDDVRERLAMLLRTLP
jgi:hypothetical protein